MFSKAVKELHLDDFLMLCISGNAKHRADWLQIILGD